MYSLSLIEMRWILHDYATWPSWKRMRYFHDIIVYLSYFKQYYQFQLMSPCYHWQWHNLATPYKYILIVSQVFEINRMKRRVYYTHLSHSTYQCLLHSLNSQHISVSINSVVHVLKYVCYARSHGGVIMRGSLWSSWASASPCSMMLSEGWLKRCRAAVLYHGHHRHHWSVRW